MKRIPVIQLGTGNVGREVIRFAMGYKDPDGNRLFRYIGIANSNSFLFRMEGIPDRILDEILSAENTTAFMQRPDLVKHNGNLSPLQKMIKRFDLSDLSIIDATDSSDTTQFLLGCAEKDVKLVLANKKPLVRDMKTFRFLKRVPLGFRATIGAGLPVIPSIEKMLSEGKNISKIEGCFSGSLGHLCSSLEEGATFSEMVKELKYKGYTEPDPREDLSGKDMARKILILSRLAEYPLDFDDVVIESLFPEKMKSLPAEAFMSEIRTMDQAFRKRFARASQKDCTLRFVATMENGICRVGLKEVYKDSLIGRLKGAEKLAVLYTGGNEDDPVVIQGAGAGANSAAKDVVDDLLEINKKNSH